MIIVITLNTCTYIYVITKVITLFGDEMQTQTEQNEMRKTRGCEIAEKSRIMKREKGGYVVPSQTGTGAYLVTYQDYKPRCECPDFEKNGILGIKCKHIWAVEIKANKRNNESKPAITVRTSYSQDWHAYNQAQTKEKELFQKLLYDLCSDIQNPVHTAGRPSLPLADMVFATALKVYTTFSLRRFITDMKDAKEKGYCDKICSYSTVSNYMRNPEVTQVLVQLIHRTALPLKTVETDFAVDSSGFGTSRFDRWFSFKYGKQLESRIWIKAHIMTGVKTHTVTSVRITEAYRNDSTQFTELVNTTAKSFTIDEVSADKAYSSRENLEIVTSHGGTAFIPFKSNVTGKQRGSKIWGKMYHFFMLNREEFLQHYHKRSNSETVFHMIKSKFGDSVRSKEWTSQVNEVLLKVLCHNITVLVHEMFELGLKPSFCLKTEEGV